MDLQNKRTYLASQGNKYTANYHFKVLFISEPGEFRDCLQWDILLVPRMCIHSPERLQISVFLTCTGSDSRIWLPSLLCCTNFQFVSDDTWLSGSNLWVTGEKLELNSYWFSFRWYFAEPLSHGTDQPELPLTQAPTSCNMDSTTLSNAPCSSKCSQACLISLSWLHYELCVSWVELFAIPWAIAHKAPLSMEFSRQEYWSGLPCPPPSQPRDRTHVSCISCIGRWLPYH